MRSDILKFSDVQYDDLYNIVKDEMKTKKIFQYLSDINRRNIEEHKAIQRKGVEKALLRKALGQGSYGRPKLILPDNFITIATQQDQHEIKLSDALRILNMKRSTYFHMKQSINF